MIQELFDRLSQYYAGFIHLPIEGKVICGVGAIVVFAALKNVWKILYPVRFVTASMLRGSAFLMHPRNLTKRAKIVTSKDVPFDVSTKENFMATAKSYKGRRVESLSDKQLNLLIDMSGLYKDNTFLGANNQWHGPSKHLRMERARREELTNIMDRQKRAIAKQNEAARVEPDKIPFVALEEEVFHPKKSETEAKSVDRRLVGYLDNGAPVYDQP